ncbi:MAG TPA: hypothetical protein VHD37_02835 [Candidatus Paceibacterota bacterium]|nr:hypothetical protein [Candidatus Paceibacterota bacterium]
MAQKKSGMGMTVGVGAGLAAAATAGAAAYWLYGAKHSAQHRKLAKSWMLKARAEVLEAVEKIQDIDKEKYMAAVGEVLKNYGGASSAEMGAMMRDFKTAWSHMQAAQKSGSKGARGAKKTGKKMVKKARKMVGKK